MLADKRVNLSIPVIVLNAVRFDALGLSDSLMTGIISLCFLSLVGGNAQLFPRGNGRSIQTINDLLCCNRRFYNLCSWKRMIKLEDRLFLRLLRIDAWLCELD